MGKKRKENCRQILQSTQLTILLKKCIFQFCTPPFTKEGGGGVGGVQISAIPWFTESFTERQCFTESLTKIHFNLRAIFPFRGVSRIHARGARAKRRECVLLRVLSRLPSLAIIMHCNRRCVTFSEKQEDIREEQRLIYKGLRDIHYGIKDERLI